MPYICIEMEERLDKILVQRNLVDSRVKAEQIISEIGVKVNGKLITKPGKKFSEDCKIELVKEEFPWIHRESLKLVEAVKKWDLIISGKIILDIDCSKGEFTEVLLSKEPKKIYSIDSNKDCLDPKIRDDKRIVDFTGYHLRELTNNNVKDKVDGCVINDTILPMNKTLPFIHPFLKQNAFVVAVIKPQFEVTKENLKNNGSVRNTLGYFEMFESLKEISNTNNLKYIDHIDSPIIGKEGQQEFIMLFRKV